MIRKYFKNIVKNISNKKRSNIRTLKAYLVVEFHFFNVIYLITSFYECFFKCLKV